jgi:hypothetical protein
MRLELRLAPGESTELAVEQSVWGFEHLFVGILGDEGAVEVPIRMLGGDETKLDFWSPDGSTLYIKPKPKL